jgi:predicted RNA binding protein YcfA (HicA-like mRNA interferase family)
MPQKIRQLKAKLKQAGFTWRPGKGSHTVWAHPLVVETVTLSGNDGDDAQDYQRKDVQKALDALEEALKQQKQQQKGQP